MTVGQLMGFDRRQMERPRQLPDRWGVRATELFVRGADNLIVAVKGGSFGRLFHSENAVHSVLYDRY